MLDFEFSTLVFQAINFLVLVGVLAWFFYKPLLRVMRQREEDIAKKLDDAQQRVTEVDKERRQLAKEREGLHADAETTIAEARTEAAQLKEQIVTNAQHRATGIVEQASRRAQEQARAARMQLQEQARKTAVRLAGEIVRQNAGPHVHCALLEQFFKGPILGAESGERALLALRDAFAAKHPEVTVELAYPPNKEVETRIRATLANSFGVEPSAIDLRLRVKSSLLAGLRLVAGTIIVDLSLGGTLERLQQEPQANEG